MTILLALLLLLPHFVRSQCPSSVSLAPCQCEESTGKSRVLCRGEIGLPRLTSILREDLCGSNIHKFELIEADIKYLPSNLFFKVIVQDIQISFTNISHFTRAGRSAFFGLEPHLESLSMRRCQLIDALQWNMIGDLKALGYLDLSYNGLTGIPKQWFQHPPPNLRSLILKGNQIATVESGALKYMYNLIELDLSENRIKNLQRSAFPFPGNALLFLRLSYNNLEALPEDMFHEMLGLRRIYLDSNNLITLPEELWRPLWGDLQHVDLLDNPLKCDCDMQWVSKLQPPLRLYGICTSSNRTGRPLKMLEADDFQECSTE